MFEREFEGQFLQCRENVHCASWISFFLLFQWGLKIVHLLIAEEWRKDVSLSMEMITVMNMSERRAAEGSILALMAGCGAFLFAFMSSVQPNTGLVIGMGLTGTFAGIFV